MKFLNKLGELPFVCIGAAHIDKISRLVEPAIRYRTNPVHASICRPGGVANNIACQLARLGVKTTLYCPPPPPTVIRQLKELGVRRRNLGSRRNSCSYTAVLDPSGELEIGLADMAEYERLRPDVLPSGFPGKRPGVVVLDAAFQPATLKAAAKRAAKLGWQVAAAATSPAKVKRLKGIPLGLLILNKAEAEVLAGLGNTRTQAQKIASRTGGWVAITLGEHGAVLLTKDEYLEQQPPHGAIKDTTGAGDAFAAALIACSAATRLGAATAKQALRFAVEIGSKKARRL